MKREDAWKIIVDDRLEYFVRYIYDHYGIREVCYMIGKPWKYITEWEEFLVWFQKEKDE